MSTIVVKGTVESARTSAFLLENRANVDGNEVLREGHNCCDREDPEIHTAC